ncbi:predicted hydrolase, HAD superfamily [Thermococcus kodakarensis KOD1]|uniref:Predicted hydrolase, HAD superfamily n=1 Tax=Thermococcus kodakarensis (strain ATCC BAA-918 / JCM 12380 / KOD1) TaxID=69014 RepID=Q5JFU5_THEKO|nr:hydrolase [Thermococcus kodakarensis]WCN28338.1 hydrolase [Thermococcus kodakarensis]WCN30634.1 hydrolase [Thermococcus kodakarensis]BAD84440.1 predicted hydrolase, HAD superfamily [Thermococcus kodakarensis KOD1]
MWLVFDVDGTLIDVGESYDMAVKLTVEYLLEELGKPSEVEIELVRELRRKGVFGDDFKLSEALVRAVFSGLNDWEQIPEGVGVEYFRRNFPLGIDPGHVERVFNTFYLGELYEDRLFDFEGLWRLEKPLVDVELLREAGERFKLGVVTGRNRLEMELAERIIGFRFPKVVTRESGLKPDPELLRCLVGGEEGVYIGDTAGDELFIENYRKKYGDFGFLMVGRDVENANEAIKMFLEEVKRGP